MGDEIVFLIAIFAVLIGILAMVIAMVVVVLNKRAGKNIPEDSSYATVLKTYSQTSLMNQNYSSGTVDSVNANRITQYFVEFKLKNGSKHSFKVKRKIFKELNDFDQGLLVFKGKKFIDFTVTGVSKKAEIDLFFIKGESSKKNLYFHGTIADFDISLSSEDEVRVNFEDLNRLIEKISEAQDDWFFTVKKLDKTAIQIEKETDQSVKVTTFIGKESIETMVMISELLIMLKNTLK